MEPPAQRPEPSPEEPVKGRPGAPEGEAPGWKRPEPDPFPGYGEPPPEARRESPPKVPRRDWGKPGNTTP